MFDCLTQKLTKYGYYFHKTRHHESCYLLSKRIVIPELIDINIRKQDKNTKEENHFLQCIQSFINLCIHISFTLRCFHNSINTKNLFLFHKSNV